MGKTALELVLARKCVIARFMLAFHRAFSCLQNFSVTSEARDPFLAPCTKPSARVSCFTTFLAQARKGTFARVVLQEF